MNFLPDSRISRRQFLHTSAWAACGLAAGAMGSPTAPAPGVSPARLGHLATGANICRWFRFPRNETPSHLSGYLASAEAELMVAMGLRHVRLCVAPKFLMDSGTGAVRTDHFRYVEAAIQQFHRAGLMVVVDIHNEDREAELSRAWQQAFETFWSQLAARLSTMDPERTMLEIINEPVFANREPEWDSLNARLAAAIRKEAPQHTILTSGPNWGGIDGLKRMKLLPDSNVVYSFHCYDPFPFTHQGATWAGEAVKPLRSIPYPSSPEAVKPALAGLDDKPQSKAMVEAYGRDQWNKGRLAARFRQAIDWGKANKVPLYCGEFGVFPSHAQPNHRAAWFRDFAEILSTHQVGWAVWGWDEGFGLNRRWTEGKLGVDETVARSLGLKVG